MSGRVLRQLRWLRALRLPVRAAVPSPLDMRDNTPVWVRLEDGTRAAGVFRDAAPDGSYAVRLDGEPGCLRAFAEVELR